MSALEEFSGDLWQVIAELEARAVDLNRRKNSLMVRGDTVLQRWANHFDAQEAAMTAAENAINKISNVPLSGVSTKTNGSEKLSYVPKVPQ